MTTAMKNTDADRFAWLAGADTGEPIAVEFPNVFNGYWVYVGDVLAERIVDYDVDTVETPEDRVEAFRRLVDAAMEAEKKGGAK